MMVNKLSIRDPVISLGKRGIGGVGPLDSRPKFQVPSGPVIDENGLAVQTGSGPPVKKSYEEVHGEVPLLKKRPKKFREVFEKEEKCKKKHGILEICLISLPFGTN